MELRVHLLVLGVLAVYTAVLVLLVARNVHALRAHAACSDVSAPLCRTLAALLDAPQAQPAVFASLGAANFHAVRILAFDPKGDVLFDSASGAPAPGKPAPPDDTQRDVRDAIGEAANGDATTTTSSARLLLHRPSGSRMAHVAGARSQNGTLVVTEAAA